MWVGSLCQEEDLAGRGHGDPLQDSCLRDPMDTGYSPWGCTEWDRTEPTQHAHTHPMKLSMGPMFTEPMEEHTSTIQVPSSAKKEGMALPRHPVVCDSYGSRKQQENVLMLQFQQLFDIS